VAITYIFAAQLDGKKFLHTLTQAAEKLNLELLPSKEETADLYLSTSKDKFATCQGLKIAVGPWSKEELKESEWDLFLDNTPIDAISAQLLLSWVLERQKLKKVTSLRHQLGNLVVILLGRILRMKLNDGDDHIKSLEALHERMGALYEDFAHLDATRS
jgi:hypothetical protein